MSSTAKKINCVMSINKSQTIRKGIKDTSNMERDKNVISATFFTLRQNSTTLCTI
jgi:hypothetical protein